ncbi:MAG TPA: phosphotransferase, partial [Chloroflexota bacterium]|nr:phosphotransferase [Chloroflexota bacterium]
DFLHGETMGQALAGERDETTRHNLLHAFGQTLRSIHQTPVPPALARPDRPWLDARLDEAADNLARFPVDGSPALLDWLRRNQPPVVPPTLIHGDFTLDNVLVQEGRVSGIIDWSDGSLGDPRYDLALATRPDEGLFQSPADFQAFAAGYGAGLPPAEIHEYFVGLYEFF